jgi:DNA-directed RNA polymerase specialized sigma24 family protein
VRPANAPQSAEPRGVEAQLASLVDYCRALLGRDDDAVRVARSVVASARPAPEDPARLRAQLFGVARKRASALLPFSGGEPLYQLPVAASRDERIHAVVLSALESLTYRDREILDLVYRHGIRPADLSAVLGIPAEEAYRRLVNAEEEFISFEAGAGSAGGPDLDDIAALPLAALAVPGRAGRLRRSKRTRDMGGSASARPFGRRRVRLAAAAVIPVAAIAWAVMYLAGAGHTDGSGGTAVVPPGRATAPARSPAPTPNPTPAPRPKRSAPPAIPIALLLPVPGRSGTQRATLPPPLLSATPTPSSPAPSSPAPPSPAPSSAPPSPSATPTPSSPAPSSPAPSDPPSG